ncbi:helix-turn-helix domain-containing protein [Psychromonas sp. PT13]|uniref:helix-turn-helix domain-containing protein n=1 Tax=Psychromonas sp. PT13 TaxID=3439547 RepID=UPI003EBFEEC9
MSQTTTLIKELKSQLKAHRKTYEDVAAHLKLSHASVKRLFSEGNISLTRLESICDMMGITMAELVLSMTIESKKIDNLSLLQEQEIADDLQLLLFTVCIINGFTLIDILQEYSLTEPECIRKLAKLDKLNIIELLPGNRFKLKISTHFAWLPDGPIQRFFLKCVQQEFFNSHFKQPTEKLIVINGLLSLSTNADIQKQMQALGRSFAESRNEDASLKMNEKHGTTMVLALRKWDSSLFNEIRKEK